MPDTQLSIALPGEQLIVRLIDLCIVLAEGQTPAQREKMWDWFIADIERWRKFWGLDDYDNINAFREAFGLPPVAEDGDGE